MDLSIIIVSYNVLPFLRQCIHSVMGACADLQFEIIVVDNNSSDGSQAFLSESTNAKVNSIFNESNVGYGKAMNQGIAQSEGHHLLFLNPDTIISRASVDLALNKLKEDLKCGAVGVRMLDGQGNFLKESKRGFPTPMSSFFKIIGLSKIFPKSEIFAQYHQGHLDPQNNYKVDILTGAFLMTKKALIKEIGGFDERYFMYGEDIDLCHSIASQGYYNYYVGETSIIHFKGESTKKESLKNTFHFYNSMLLFTKKYKPDNILFTSILSVILFIIGSARWLKLNVLPIFGPIIRVVLYGLAFWGISKAWGYFYFGNAQYYNYRLHHILISSYALILMLGFYFSDGQLSKLGNLLWSTIVIWAIYSLLPLDLRSSRAVIALGTTLIIGMEICRMALESYRLNGTPRFWKKERNAILLGTFEPCIAAFEKLNNQKEINYLGIVSDRIQEDARSISDFNHLEHYLSKNKVDTLTMHMESMTMDRILKIISKLGTRYQYLLFSSDTNAIIDSPDSNTQGRVSLVEILWAIDKPINRRAKRILDIVTSIVFIVLSPLLIWFVKNKSGWIANIFGSIQGKTSWVGYSKDDFNLDQLPKLRPSVIGLSHETGQGHFENISYARDYNLVRDLKLIINSFADLGNKVEFNAKN